MFISFITEVCEILCKLLNSYPGKCGRMLQSHLKLDIKYTFTHVQQFSFKQCYREFIFDILIYFYNCYNNNYHNKCIYERLCQSDYLLNARVWRMATCCLYTLLVDKPSDTHSPGLVFHRSHSLLIGKKF